MIFNLNEQKVLSDPSGSSVFKGEKDFNDIVVNLPDNIDGHTATQLNYVMHFVDSDGGYSTKILNVDSSGEALKATATVSTSITSKAQAFYAYVLMTDDEETVIGKTNGVIVMIHPVPDEENEIIPPADADKIIKGLEEIVKEATETIETATDTIEEATEAISSKQDKLTAGENITITEENVISASSGSNDYTDLTNKPSINNVTLSGNKTSDDLNLQGKLTAGENITIDEDNVISAEGGVTSYNDLTDKPAIIAANSATGYRVSKPLEGVFDFQRFLYFATNPYGETSLQIKNEAISQNMLNEDLQDYLFKCYGIPDEYYSDMFISAEHAPDKTGVWYINRTDLEGMPIPAYGYLFNYLPELRVQIYWTASYNSAENSNRIFFREQYMGGFRDWIELTGGGSQIVSGVVNANGTITFTDSEGNTFTTTGSSVIGTDGFSPVATVTQTASGATVSITDSTGTTTANISNGADGQDYVLTAQDKSDIADIVLSELPTTQGVLYGNTSN